RVIKLDLLDQVTCLPVIVFCFAWEPHDYIGGDCDATARLSNLANQIHVFLSGICAMHCFENFIGAGLQRQMNVLGKFRQPRDCVDQVLAEAARMRRSESESLKSVDVVNGFKQLNKRGLFVVLLKLSASIKLTDLYKLLEL